MRRFLPISLCVCLSLFFSFFFIQLRWLLLNTHMQYERGRKFHNYSKHCSNNCLHGFLRACADHFRTINVCSAYKIHDDFKKNKLYLPTNWTYFTNKLDLHFVSPIKYQWKKNVLFDSESIKSTRSRRNYIRSIYFVIVMFVNM